MKVARFLEQNHSDWLCWRARVDEDCLIQGVKTLLKLASNGFCIP
jgi:hypothetical protein